MIGPPRNVQMLFRRLIDNVGGPRTAAKILHVTARTVGRWIADQAPYQAAALLWWTSPIGRESIGIDDRNLITTLRRLTDSLDAELATERERCANLEAALDAATGRIAANDGHAYGRGAINIGSTLPRTGSRADARTMQQAAAPDRAAR